MLWPQEIINACIVRPNGITVGHSEATFHMGDTRSKLYSVSVDRTDTLSFWITKTVFSFQICGWNFKVFKQGVQCHVFADII